jgi:1,5-anhydro-D-fructose reductase (1,5-anhydro-D-mannitol-forming)
MIAGMNSSPVRFAILGFGLHAERRLIPAFKNCKDAVLVGIWRRDREVGAKNCLAHGIQHCFASAEALCASPEVDVVFITSPDAMHLADSLLAISHAKAVLCEKPLAMNAGEAGTIAASAAAAGVLFGVGQNFRFNHSVEWMREQIVAGKIGTPQLAHAQYCYPVKNSARKWVTNPDLATGGPIADVGVHCIDTLRFLLDEEVTSIATLGHSDEASGRVEAIATLQLAMTGGVYANVTASGRAQYRTLIEVTGSDGVLIAENGLSVDRPVEVVLRRGGDFIESVTVQNEDGYTRMLDAFAATFRGAGTFTPTGFDALHNMRAVDAAYASLRSGARENL